MSQAPFTEPLAVVTNAFELKIPPAFRYHQYDDIKKMQRDVQKDPKKDARGLSTTKCTTLFHALQLMVAPEVFDPRMVYDGKKLAYCKKELFSAMNFYVKYDKKNNLIKADLNGDLRGAFQITLTKTSGETVEANDYKELFERNTTLGPRSKGERAKNVIQLIVLQGPNLHHRINRGSSYFGGAPRDVQNTGKGIELWRGIFLSVRPAPSRLILTVDTCATAVYRAGKLIDVCMNYLNIQNVAQLDLSPNSPNFVKLEKFLVKVRVKVRIGQSNSKEDKSHSKIVRGLVPNAGRFKFAKGNIDSTVEEHFNEAHNIRLRFPHIIGVSFERKGSDRQNVVPAELCEVEAGQICNRIPDELRGDLVKFSALKPNQRKQRIIEEVNSYQRSELLVESKLQIQPEMIGIKGKRLFPPKIAYKNQQVDSHTGGWNVKNAKVWESAGLENWAVVSLCRNVGVPDVQKYARDLQNCCAALGIDPKPPLVLDQGNPMRVEDLLNGVVDKAKKNPAANMDEPIIIIVLLEQDAGPIRTRIKYWGDISCGVLTQCLRFGKFNNYQQNNRNNNQYWNNVAIKINARLGGTNSYADSPFFRDIMSTLGKFMVIGADVGHPGPGTQFPSVSSIVYSWDRYAAKYSATTGIQQPRQEIIADLRTYLKQAITNFGRLNGTPSYIFFFRDGVSEGQYLTVAREERDELQAAIDEVWLNNPDAGDVKPKVTFIIVTKRHHAVFFPPGQHDNNNCPPGLVVDSTITNPAVPNFYLQSHQAIQGTSRSSHYVVLQDDAFGYDLNKLQHLSYYLCNVYAKATRSVSIPAPVYYADLVCSRLMFHLNTDKIPAEAQSTISGTVEFDLPAWQRAFQQLNPGINKRMYFL